MEPVFDSVPLDAYGDLPPQEDDDREYSAEDLGFEPVKFEKHVPIPPYKPRVAKKPFASARTMDEVRPFLELPESIYSTVIGRLAVIVADKLEFPEASTFLALLASASSAVSCAYATQYKSRTAVALGLYAIIEQPPATQKSYLLSIGGNAYAMAIGEHNKKIAAKHRENKERDIEKDETLRYGFGMTTDATSAAMDRGLANCSEGRFVVSSAEQSALTSLFPESGTFSSNNELILKGYAGEYVNGMRGGREAFTGVVQGSIILIAQSGSSKRVIVASNGTGMAERFFFMAEPTMLGGRELKGEFPHSRDTAPFETACQKCVELYSDRILAPKGGEREILDPVKLNKVVPTDNGYDMILARRREREYELGLLGEQGETIVLSWLGKYETHVLKVASVLHVIESLGNGCYPPETIPDDMIKIGMDFVDMLAEHMGEIMHDAGESGTEAEEDCFIEVLSQKPLSRREVLLKAKNRKPFRSMGRNAYASANKRLDAMLEAGVLVVSARGKLEVV